MSAEAPPTRRSTSQDQQPHRRTAQSQYVLLAPLTQHQQQQPLAATPGCIPHTTSSPSSLLLLPHATSSLPGPTQTPSVFTTGIQQSGAGGSTALSASQPRQTFEFHHPLQHQQVEVEQAADRPAATGGTDPALLACEVWPPYPPDVAADVQAIRRREDRGGIRTRRSKKCVSFAPPRSPVAEETLRSARRRHKEYEDCDSGQSPEDSVPIKRDRSEPYYSNYGDTYDDERTNDYNYDSEASTNDPRYRLLVQRPSGRHAFADSVDATVTRPKQVVLPRPGNSYKPATTTPPAQIAATVARTRGSMEQHSNNAWVRPAPSRPMRAAPPLPHQQTEMSTFDDHHQGSNNNRCQVRQNEPPQSGQRRGMAEGNNSIKSGAASAFFAASAADDVGRSADGCASGRHYNNSSPAACGPDSDSDDELEHESCNALGGERDKFVTAETSFCERTQLPGDYDYLHRCVSSSLAAQKRTSYNRRLHNMRRVDTNMRRRGASSGCWGLCVRFLCCGMAALVAGMVVFLWLLYRMPGLTPAWAGAAAAVVGTAVLLLLCSSRLCRCLTAIQPLCIATPDGCTACLLLVTGLLLAGPVANMHANMADVSRCLDCQALRAQRQVADALQPFWRIVAQLLATVDRLHQAAANVTHGLRPLSERVLSLEKHRQDSTPEALLGTGAACEAMIRRAYNDCVVTMKSAHRRCDVTLSTLSYMSVATKQLLENLDFAHLLQPPSPDHQPHRRNSPTVPSAFAGSERNPCDMLNTTTCSNLSEAERICKTAHMVGETIGDTINATLGVVRYVERTFHISDLPPQSGAQVNISSLAAAAAAAGYPGVGQSSFGHIWQERVAVLGLLIDISARLTLLAVLLLLRCAYVHIKQFMSVDDYNNTHITRHFCAFDRQLSKADCLLPLRRCETSFLTQVRRQEEPRPISVALTLHIVLAIVLHLLDLGLWLVLQAIRDHAQLQAYDSRLQRNVTLAAAADGGRSRDDRHFRSFLAAASADTDTVCMPEPKIPSIEGLAFTVLLYALLMLAVVLRAPLFDRCTLVMGHFYPERQAQRALFLHARLAHRRARLFHLLLALVRRRHREMEAEKQFLRSASSSSGRMMTSSRSSFACCRTSSTPRCLACLTLREASLVYCDSDMCDGVYCVDCFADLGQRCPLCINYDENIRL